MKLLETLDFALRQFKTSFREGYDMASKRIKLARRGASHDEMVEYFVLRQDFEREKMTFSSLLGYAFGTYTNYCPFQIQLDNFDRRFLDYEESLDSQLRDS